MLSMNLQHLDLLRAWSAQDPTVGMEVTFPIFSAHGARSSSCVYMELEPGCRLGRHTDSAEEIVLILEGQVTGVIGDERGELSTGGLVLIPALVPHDLINTGDRKARAIGFFSSATVVSVFDDALQPMNRRVLGTPPPAEEVEAQPV